MPQGVFGSLAVDDVPQSVRVKFAVCVQVAERTDRGCWLWPKSSASHGYGQIGWGGKGEGRGLVLAHRLSYATFFGPIPEGMTVDHVCRERTCFNPEHLRLLTNLENARNNGNSIKTHCPHGHAYDEANTSRDRLGHRRCIACAQIRKRVA